MQIQSPPIIGGLFVCVAVLYQQQDGGTLEAGLVFGYPYPSAKQEPGVATLLSSKVHILGSSMVRLQGTNDSKLRSIDETSFAQTPW